MPFHNVDRWCADLYKSEKKIAIGLKLNLARVRPVLKGLKIIGTVTNKAEGRLNKSSRVTVGELQ